jgi:hypothetical protein
MKRLKMLGLTALAAMALAVFAASSASATTLEVGGTKQNGSVVFTASLHEGHLIWARTDGSFANSCLEIHMAGDTQTFTGSTVTAPLDSLSFTNCIRSATVHKAGTLHIAHIGGTNGTVSSSGDEITMPSPFGTLNCKTGAGSHLGTLTGTASGHATIHFNAVVNCGFLVPSATWKGTLKVTSPTGLGVVA